MTSRLPLGSLADTELYARAAGWHIWSGSTIGGHARNVILCPEHAGNLKRDSRARPEWDEPLW